MAERGCDWPGMEQLRMDAWRHHRDAPERGSHRGRFAGAPGAQTVRGAEVGDRMDEIDRIMRGEN